MLTIREVCDACEGPLEDVFSMGSMPLANGLLPADKLTQPGESFPLMVAECQACSLAQLRFVVDPAELYRDYRFYTGASSPNVAYFGHLASLIKQRATGPRVLEIGSNDGTLLQALERQGLDVTGIDPAASQCDAARTKLTRGRVVCDYWGSRSAYDQKGLFDVVVACNVLGHSNDLRDFASSVKRVLRTDGLFVVEVQYLNSLIKQAAFELIYHEHVSYFDEVSLARLLTSCGFKVVSWETTAAQCGTLRMWASGWGGGTAPEIMPRYWKRFEIAIDNRRERLLDVIDAQRIDGRRVCFYGSPAKATQIANYWRLGTNLIQFATDTTPAKQGHYIPGAMIPIVPPSHLKPSDAAIVAAWNYWPDIVAQESAFIANGGVLINPATCEVAR